MRISCDPTDPGYRSNASRYRVTVDGAEPQACITADDVEGMVICNVIENGVPITDPNNRHEFLTITIYGRIEIIPPTVDSGA